MESHVHLRTGRRDEKDVKIQLKIENRGEGVGVTGNGNQHHRERCLPGNLIENRAKTETSGERAKR